MARLSIIVALYNEEPNIAPLYKRLCSVIERLLEDEVEIIFVDDGSTDGSCREIRSLPASGPAISLVSLSRNFGSQAAVAAGIGEATGDVITFLAADLQDPPELVLTMMDKWREGFEVVGATRISRSDPPVTKLLARWYYGLLRRWAVPQMPPGGVDVCLADRRVVRSLGNLQERNSNLACLLLWAGFSQCFVPYEREARKMGRSKWSLGKRLKLFTDSFVAFSFFPMRLISTLGAIFSALGMLYALLIAIQALTWRVAVPGWSSLMVVVLFCSGVQLLMLGIISEYLWRSLDTSRGRPTFIVREVVHLCGGVEGAGDGREGTS